MSNDAQVAAHIALVTRYADGEAWLHEVESSAIALHAEQPDAKDAARYRQLVAMKDKAAPETIAHYVRNPAHLDRVIEVMEQKS